MESLTFQCPACGTRLMAPADKVGRVARCKRCGEVVAIPATGSPPRPPEPPPAAPFEVVEEPEPNPAPRRKRRRGKTTPERLAAIRNAPGWRRVRLGLILLAIPMCWQVLWAVLSLFVSLDWAPVYYLLGVLPIAGHLLCAFVPIKGVARKLVMANLVVLAFGLALSAVAGWMTRQALTDSERAAQERTARLEARHDERARQWQEEDDLRKKLTELRERAEAGDKDAVKEEQAAVAKLTEARNRHTAEATEALEQLRAEIETGPTMPRTGGGRFWEWVHTSVRWYLLQHSVQIIILTFFVRAVALELGELGLAANCPRVAALTLLLLALFLIGQLIPQGFSAGRSVTYWVSYPLGLACYLWMGLMLIDAAGAIGRHLDGQPR